jgi:hypothetical protein
MADGSIELQGRWHLVLLIHDKYLYNNRVDLVRICSLSVPSPVATLSAPSPRGKVEIIQG